MVEKVCKECKHWRKSDVFHDSRVGVCEGLTINSANVLTSLDMEATNYPLPYFSQDFGCIHWEEKERGPFLQCNEKLCYNDCGTSVHMAGLSHATIRIIVDWLNKLWLQRDCKPKVEWKLDKDDRFLWHDCFEKINEPEMVVKGFYCTWCGAKAELTDDRCADDCGKECCDSECPKGLCE